jgi:hypothetical protein
MTTLASPDRRVKTSSNPNRAELSDSPRLFSLRRAAGFVRHAIRVDVAILTGDRSGRFLGTVGLLQVSKAAALRLLKRLRGCGGKSILCFEVEHGLILGATSLLHLMD